MTRESQETGSQRDTHTDIDRQGAQRQTGWTKVEEGQTDTDRKTKTDRFQTKRWTFRKTEIRIQYQTDRQLDRQ